jgi:hypothetical protein
VQDDLRSPRASRDDHFARKTLSFSRQFAALLDTGTSGAGSLSALAERQDDESFKEVSAGPHSHGTLDPPITGRTIADGVGPP